MVLQSLEKGESRARIAARETPPVLLWAAAGMCMVAFEVYVWMRWLTGSNLRPTDPGSDPISDWERAYYIGLQIAVPVLWALCMWFWVIKPWMRERRMTSDGMIAIACWAICIFDCIMNYTSLTLLYNSQFVNFGAWTTGSFPGWTQPNGNHLPEPIFVTIPGYVALVYSQVVFVCMLLRRAKARWPGMGILGAIGFVVLGLTLVDSIIEIFLIRSGVYAYPGGIREVTLFAGETYQFPLTEGFLFGGLAFGSVAVLKHFKDDKGSTFVERGVDQLRVGERSRTGLRFFAIFAYVHLMFLALYGVPNQWLATHSDPFPAGYPSYLTNGMCVYGDTRDQCPGPGVSIPRPENNPF